MKNEIYVAPSCVGVPVAVPCAICASLSSIEDYTGFNPWTADFVG